LASRGWESARTVAGNFFDKTCAMVLLEGQLRRGAVVAGGFGVAGAELGSEAGEDVEENRGYCEAAG
jgi:hypothetical protein